MGPKGLLGLLCAASLVAGAGLGIVLDRTALAHAEAKGGHDSPFVRHVIERLALDEAQASSARAIFEARRPRFLDILREVRPQLQALHDETDAELRKILRVDQVAKLEEMRREENEKWEQPKR